MSPDRPMPARARVLIGGVALGGAGVLALHLPAAFTWALMQTASWSLLVLAMVVTEQFPISLEHRGEGETFGLTDAIWVAALILVPPDVLILAATAGTLIGQVVRRVSPAKIAFNLGQYLIGLGIAVAAYTAIAPESATEPRTWLAAVAAMSLFFLVNEASVAAVITLVTGKSLRDVLLPSLSISVLHWAGNMAIGILGAVLWVTAPLSLILIVAPLALSYLAYRGWLQSMRERDRMDEMARTADEITEQKDLTRRLQGSGTGDAVARLTATLNAMLDRLDRSFVRERRFLSEASHELRTPITVCRANLELLQPDATPGEVAASVTLVVDELARMTRIVEEMTTLARMEHPSFLRREPVDLVGLVRAVTAKAQPLLGDRLRTGALPAAAVVRADPQRVTQALLNLLENVRVHVPDESPVRVDLRSSDATWRIDVTDEGGGLPPGEEELLFEPFRRGAGRSRGSGLGLAIVRAVAEAHGGAAGVDNRPPEGATFWMTIPTRQDSADVLWPSGSSR